MSEHLSEKADIKFLYKIVSNNIIIKINVSISPEFIIEKDDVKFGFNLHLIKENSSGMTGTMKVPI